MAITGNLTIGIVVEGHGEEQAVPVLVRKIASAHYLDIRVICEVRRVPKSQLLKSGELERTVEALARQTGRNQPILILLDSDDDCPRELAQKLRARCNVSHADLYISIVIAKREYEAWFLASTESLAGHGGLQANLITPGTDPEAVRGAKEWLSNHMIPGQSYSPTRHQAAFSSLINLAHARSSRSFRKLEKELALLLELG